MNLELIPCRALSLDFLGRKHSSELHADRANLIGETVAVRPRLDSSFDLVPQRHERHYPSQQAQINRVATVGFGRHRNTTQQQPRRQVRGHP